MTGNLDCKLACKTCLKCLSMVIHKPHANGRNITSCARLHTLLHVVASCWEKFVTSNNFGRCWPTMLRPFAQGFTHIRRYWLIEIEKLLSQSGTETMLVSGNIQERMPQGYQ